MVLNWDEVEKHCSEVQDLPDCIPSNAREWSRFKDQYEACVSFIQDLPNSDPSSEDLIKDWFKIANRGGTGLNLSSTTFKLETLGITMYKKSVFECADNLTNDNFSTSNLSIRLSSMGIKWTLINAVKTFFRRMVTCEINSFDVSTTGNIITILPKHVFQVHAAQREISSMIGMPTYVYENFACQSNKLECWNGVPKYVGGEAKLNRNKLESLPPTNVFFNTIDLSNNPIAKIVNPKPVLVGRIINGRSPTFMPPKEEWHLCLTMKELKECQRELPWFWVNGKHLW